MLTRQEQQQVMDKVRRIVRVDAQYRTWTRKGQMSERQRKACSQKAMDELADMLKEIG